MAVELTKSAKASVKDVERIRKLSGPAKETAEKVVRRKRRQKAQLSGALNAIRRNNQTTDSNN